MDSISNNHLKEILNLEKSHVTCAIDSQIHKLTKGTKHYLEKIHLQYKDCNYFCTKEEFEGKISKVEFLIKQEDGNKRRLDAKFFREVIAIIENFS